VRIGTSATRFFARTVKSKTCSIERTNSIGSGLLVRTASFDGFGPLRARDRPGRLRRHITEYTRSRI
jgi:hypothetical protein